MLRHLSLTTYLGHVLLAQLNEKMAVFRRNLRERFGGRFSKFKGVIALREIRSEICGRMLVLVAVACASVPALNSQSVPPGSIARSRVFAIHHPRQAAGKGERYSLMAASTAPSVEVAAKNLEDARKALDDARKVADNAKDELDAAAEAGTEIGQLKAQYDSAQTALKKAVTAESAAEAELSEATRAFVTRTSAVTEETCVRSDGTYHPFAPVWRPSCWEESRVQQVLDFFQSESKVQVASTVQYLYNSSQSTNQLSSQLLTATFLPGFQAVLGSTVTAGSTQVDPQTNATTDSVDTAVAKLQGGGDFNLHFNLPFLFWQQKFMTVYAASTPAIGFNVNGMGQTTITESNEYNVSIPSELYAETFSIDSTDGNPNGLFWVDYKPSWNAVPRKYAEAIGIDNRHFAMQEISSGIQFAGNVRVGFQYFLGPRQTFVNSSGAKVTDNSLSGLHLVVTFNPHTAAKSAARN